jgi:Protein of unknown function (DUF4197)
MTKWKVFAVLFACATSAVMAGGALNALSALTAGDRTGGLRAALTQAVDVAVANLGKTDGFLGNPEVKIPLPGKLEKARKTLKMLGMNKQTDELVTAMNRAAEAAVPEAKTLFVDSIKQMSVNDAMAILSGPQDAATQYFRTSMTEKLSERFLPIVGKATQKVALAQRYNDVAGKASSLGLVDSKDANLDSYVTRKALDGLFATMAKEEAKIRVNPMGQASSLIKKVFGAIGK